MLWILKATFLFTLICCSLGLDVFNSIPSISINLLTKNATVVKQSPDESLIFVGFNNGTVISMNFGAVIQAAFVTGRTNSITQVNYFPGLVAYVTAMDSGSNGYVWYLNGTSVLNFAFPSTVYSASWAKNYGILYCAVSYGANITQYVLSNGFQLNAVAVSTKTTFISVKYMPSSIWLVAGTANNYIFYFNNSGLSIDSSYVSTTSPVSQFTQIDGNSLVALTTNNQMILLNSPGYNSYITSIPSTTAFTGCPNGFIVTGSSSSNTISVYSENGAFYQYLYYTKNTVIGADCGNNYLVTLDASGYVQVAGYAYYEILVKLAGWAIAVIVVFSVLCCGGIAFLIYCCCKKRKLNMAVQLNATNKEIMLNNNSNFQRV